MKNKLIGNTLWTGDNLYILNGLNSESVDLIYLDPPFNSKRMYSAPVGSKLAGVSFKDMWTWRDVDKAYLETMINDYPSLVSFIQSIEEIHSAGMMSYITYMAQRIIVMHRILKETGSFYLHCDSTANHYLKIVLDKIFGKNNFRNEIIWCYAGPSNTKRWFARKHDTVLFYSKGNLHNFNIQYTNYKSGLHNEGTLFGKRGGNALAVREREKKGKPMEDYWNIPSGAHISKEERTGYPTQKPLALLHRIIKASSNEGDVVLDPFCGCATTCVASQQLGRKWIGIDIAKAAKKVLIERLSDDAGLFKDFVAREDIPQRTDIKQESPKSTSVKEKLYKNQEGICNGCVKEFDIQNYEVDHIVPESKGGGNYYDNYQLLCGHCNRTKGNRPMEYLVSRINQINETSKNLTFGGKQ